MKVFNVGGIEVSEISARSTAVPMKPFVLVFGQINARQQLLSQPSYLSLQLTKSPHSEPIPLMHCRLGLSGNQAVTRGALEASVRLATGYPGAPSPTSREASSK